MKSKPGTVGAARASTAIAAYLGMDQFGGAPLPAAATAPDRPTEQTAVAEATRLMAAGHSRDSALEAMNRSGWNVE